MNYTQDAPQQAMAFLIAQSSHIETEVYQIKYQDIQYPDLVPVDTSAPDWVPSVTYFSMDRVGQAKWFSGHAQDVPNAEVLRNVQTTGVSMAAIGYRYDLSELGQAQLLSMNLTTDKAAAARRASEEFIDRTVLLGDASKGFTGLLNSPAVTAGTAAAVGAGNSTTFANKTSDQILADVNNVLSGVFTGSLGVEMADTLLLPYGVMLALNTRRIDTVNQTTILQWIELNNIYTRMTGQKLTIRGVWGLETLGAGGTQRMAAYRKDPTVVKFYMPMPFRFMPVWQVGPIIFEVPGIFRLGGTDIRRPAAFRYLDGIA